MFYLNMINKMVGMEILAYLVRWMAAFLLDFEQRVNIGDMYVKVRVP